MCNSVCGKQCKKCRFINCYRSCNEYLIKKCSKLNSEEFPKAINQYCFVDIINTNNTDLFGDLISIDDNTFYLWDLTSIKRNSLINMNTIRTGTELAINYNTNTFYGKRLNMSGVYVINTKGIRNFLNSVYFRGVSTCLRVDSASITDKKDLITSEMNLQNKKIWFTK